MKLLDGISKAISLRDGKTMIETFGNFWGLSNSSEGGYISACLNTMGNYFASSKLRLYRKKADTLKEIYDHPFLEMWESPNDFQVTWELKYFIGVYFGVKGNYYLLVLKGLSSGKPRQLIMLDPMRVKPITANGKWIDHYEYNTGKERYDLDPNDIIHLRYPYSGSVIEGKPILDAIKDVVDVDKLQTQLTKKFYKEGGFMGQVFSTKGVLSNAAFDRAEKQLRTKFSGTENAFKVALFEQGLEPIKAAYSIKDMELSIQRKLTKEEILTAFRMPQLLVGGSAEGYTKASSESAEYVYAQSMIDPMLKYIDQVLTRKVKLLYGQNLVIKHDSVAPKDTERQLKYYMDMTSMGAMTINEVRVEEDFEPYPYELADASLINVGGAIIDVSNGEQLGSVPNNVPLKPEPKKSFEEDFKSMKWRQFDRRFQRQAKLFGTKVEEFFDSQEKRLLEVLDEKNIFKIEDFFNSEAEYIIFKNMLESELVRILKEGHSFTSPGTPFNSADSFVKNVILEITKKAHSINETTKTQLIEFLRDKTNLSNSELINEVKQKFTEIKANRVERIVNTTVASGMNAGILLALKNNGAKFKIWLSMRDSKVRHSHITVDGQKVKINDKFEVNGEFLDFPADPKGSAKENINCRCLILGE